jgi:hypothetical protein
MGYRDCGLKAPVRLSALCKLWQVVLLYATLTCVVAECSDSLLRLTTEVQTPCAVRSLVTATRLRDRHLILTNYSLSVKDEERRDIVRCPSLEVSVNMCRDARQPGEGSKERLMVGSCVEEVLQIKSGIDSDGTVFDLRNGMRPVQRDV